MTPTTTQYQYLAPNPKSLYRQLFVKGTRTMARTLYGYYKNAEEPQTPEQIAAACNLLLAAVQEAIAYCESNPPEIAIDAAREEAIMEASGMNDPLYKFNPRPKLISNRELADILDRFTGPRQWRPPSRYIHRAP